MIIKKINTNEKFVWLMKINEYKINKNFSWTLIEINWNHWKLKCLNEDRIYFILEWKWQIIINDKITEIEPEDLIFIPKNTPYNIIWKMKYFLICSPEFNKEDDVFL